MVLGLLVLVTPSKFFRRILRSEAWFTNHIFFRTAVPRRLFDIIFSYKHCNFSRACLIMKMTHKLVSSRRKFLIRIVLLQRKTLNETKNRLLKCLKGHYSTGRSWNWLLHKLHKWTHWTACICAVRLPDLWINKFWALRYFFATLLVVCDGRPATQSIVRWRNCRCFRIYWIIKMN